MDVEKLTVVLGSWWVMLAMASGAAAGVTMTLLRTLGS